MKREGLLLGGIGVVTLIIVIAAAFMLSGPSTKSDTPEGGKITNTALLLGPQAQRTSEGTSSAKVTIVEFGDFQCPACGAAYPVVKQIKNEYQDRIYFVSRNFPLPQHVNASFAAEAAYAAFNQDKFWQMHDKLYESQSEWGEKSQAEAKELIEGYAQALGLDMTAFTQSVEKNAAKEKIQKDQNDGYQVGVNSTPTFFINGEKYTGVVSFDQFKKLIDEKLK